MTIGRIGHTEPIQNNKVNRPSPAEKPGKGDSVHISAEAKEKAELLGALELVSAAPDVRAQRIAELKAKINDSSYISDAVLAGAADNIIDLLIPPSK